MIPGLSILMPVFNERDTVEHAIRETMAAQLPVEHELVVVDDGSTDGTGQILSSTSWPAGVSIYHHAANQGKGAAVRTAAQQARGELCSILDADLEYRASDLAELLPPLLTGEANVVFGIRAFSGFTSHSYLFVLGNKGVTTIANVLYNVYLRDIMTCHKAMHTALFRSLPLTSRGFAIEAEITARLLQRGERIYEVPVSYHARTTAEGKKLTAVDGLRVTATLLRCRLSPDGVRVDDRAAPSDAPSLPQPTGGTRKDG